MTRPDRALPVAVIGAGFSGTMAALQLLAATDRIRRLRLAQGHLLHVGVHALPRRGAVGLHDGQTLARRLPHRTYVRPSSSWSDE